MEENLQPKGRGMTWKGIQGWLGLGVDNMMIIKSLFELFPLSLKHADIASLLITCQAHILPDTHNKSSRQYLFSGVLLLLLGWNHEGVGSIVVVCWIVYNRYGTDDDYLQNKQVQCWHKWIVRKYDKFF